MFKFWGSQEQDAQPLPQEIPTNSWYPSSLHSSPSSTHPTTPSSSSSSSYNVQRPADRPQSPAQVSPSEALGIIYLLKDKSIDELRKLLADKDAYCQFLLSLDQVKIQNNLRDELRKETLQLARENLEKEPQIMELQNQCRIIRTTELAAAQEKLHELEKQKQETLQCYSPTSLIFRLQGKTLNKTPMDHIISSRLHHSNVDSSIMYSRPDQTKLIPVSKSCGVSCMIQFLTSTLSSSGMDPGFDLNGTKSGLTKHLF